VEACCRIKKAPRRDAKKEFGGAEVPVGNPKVSGGDALQHLDQQTALLGIGIFAGKGVSQQHPVGLQNDQSQARQRCAAQGPQFFQPVLRPRQMIPVDDLRAVAAHQGLAWDLQGIDDGRHAGCRLAHQLPRHLRLHTPHFPVNLLDSYREGFFAGLIGVVDRVADADRHQAQQLDCRREQQLAGLLPPRVFSKHVVQQLRRHRILQRPTEHHTHRTVFHKPIQDFVEHWAISVTLQTKRTSISHYPP